MQKSICFILSVTGTRPVGGVKVVYEYANRFYEAGYDVAIFYPRRQIDNPSIKSKLRYLYYFVREVIFRNYKGRWFPLNKGIKQFLMPALSTKKKDSRLNDYDCVCATAVETAYYLNAVLADSLCKKFYFIQDYEVWGKNNDEYVQKSYTFPFQKIVIAPWLHEKVNLVGEKSELIYNGFDFNYFFLKNNIEERSSLEISMLYHKAAHKCTEDAIKALKIVHEKYPKIHVSAFGTPLPPNNLPSWITYSRMPDKKKLNEIYNTSSIYIAASETEGFGLTVGESMICGNAVCCTDNAGFTCMVKNKETGLTSPVRAPESLAENIEHLIEDKDFRIKLAQKGNEYIRSFTWEKSFEKFLNLVEITK